MFWFWLEWFWFQGYHDWCARRRGEQDGSKNEPGWYALPQPRYVMQLQQVADSTVGRHAEIWEKKREQLGPRILIAQEAEIRASQELRAAQKAYEDARDEFKQKHQNAQPPAIPKEPWWYLPSMAGVAFLEVPFNYVAFQILRENLVVTIAAALAVGSVLAIFAHSAGMELNQDPTKYPRSRAEGIMWIVSGVAATVVVAMLREEYLAYRLRGVPGATHSLRSQEFFSFWVLNLALFAAATALSILAHKNPELQIAYKNLRRAEKRWAAAHREHARARAAYECAYKYIQQRALRIRDGVQRTIEVYRQANMDKRTDVQDHVPPKRCEYYDPGSGQTPQCRCFDSITQQCSSSEPCSFREYPEINMRGLDQPLTWPTPPSPATAPTPAFGETELSPQSGETEPPPTSGGTGP